MKTHDFGQTQTFRRRSHCRHQMFHTIVVDLLEYRGADLRVPLVVPLHPTKANGLDNSSTLTWRYTWRVAVT
jgi:hypothetical protein